MNQPILKIINKEFIINNVPLEKISIGQGTIIIELDDKSEKRYRLLFSPLQAQKTTTIDCVNSDAFFCDECLETGKYQRYIMEVGNSEWIKQLKSDLMKNDEGASFMEKARHFVLDLGDSILEIVAWNYKLEEVL